MKKELILALALPSFLAVGCAGSNANRHNEAAQKQAQDDAAAQAEENDAQPPPKLHGPKKRIGIVDFDDASHHSSWGGSRDALAEAARDVTTEAMVKSGAFVVIEREQIAQILKEQGLGMTGAISPQTAAKAGKLLGLQALVTGKITDFTADEKASGFGGYYQERRKDFHARVSLRMIDATTGEIMLSAKGEGVSTKGGGLSVGGLGHGGGAGFSMGSSEYKASALGEAQEQACKLVVQQMIAKKDRLE